MDSVLSDVAQLQTEYNNLADSGRLTKRSICTIVIPFRDKYSLSDLQALQVARSELTVAELDSLLNGSAVSE